MIEYQIRPVTRYIITRFEQDGPKAGSESFGEFASYERATELSHALVDQENAKKQLAGALSISYPRPLVRQGLNLAQVIGIDPIPEHHPYTDATDEIIEAVYGKK